MTAPPPQTPRVRIDLGALVRNARALGAMAPGRTLAPVVKADAYGLGAGPVTRALAQGAGVDTVFVAHTDEAAALLSEVPLARVFVLNGCYPDPSLRPEVRPVLHTAGMAAAWGTHGPCALALDIGMNRLGMTLGEAMSLPMAGGIDPQAVELIVMHLSHSGEPPAMENRQQQDVFARNAATLRDVYPNAVFSLSASGGCWLSPSPAEGLIRPGISVYGGAADGVPTHSPEAVATFEAPVIAVRTVEPGETAGYSGRWRASRPSTLAVLAAGYADGVPRSLYPKGRVILGGVPCPIAGTVSMDLTTVDVTELPKPPEIGAYAELFGPRRSIDQAAQDAGTIAYELLTRLGARVERVYEDRDSDR